MEYREITLSAEEYRQLVRDTVNGSYIPHVQHTIAVCREDDHVVMVYNYFRYAFDTMFLHRAWFADAFAKKIRKRHYWDGFYAFAKTLGYRYIMGVINAQNTPALLWALKTGWTITGTRQTAAGHLIVDVLIDFWR